MASDKHRNIADEIVGNGPVAVAGRDFEKFSSAIADALSNAEREGMKRAAEFANKQFECCRERKSSADTDTQDNFWGGCADTAAIIRDRILSEAKEGE